MLEDLKALVSQYDLLERAEGAFWKNLSNYRREEKEEFERYFPDYQEEKIEVWLRSVSYKVQNWSKGEDTYEYIVIGMDFACDNHIIGTYEACFNMEGKWEDDYFVCF